jgi:hypothetical protein
MIINIKIKIIYLILLIFIVGFVLAGWVITQRRKHCIERSIQHKYMIDECDEQIIIWKHFKETYDEFLDENTKRDDAHAFASERSLFCLQKIKYYESLKQFYNNLYNKYIYFSNNPYLGFPEDPLEPKEFKYRKGVRSR